MESKHFLSSRPGLIIHNVSKTRAFIEGIGISGACGFAVDIVLKNCAASGRIRN